MLWAQKHKLGSDGGPGEQHEGLCDASKYKENVLDQSFRTTKGTAVCKSGCRYVILNEPEVWVGLSFNFCTDEQKMRISKISIPQTAWWEEMVNVSINVSTEVNYLCWVCFLSASVCWENVDLSWSPAPAATPTKRKSAPLMKIHVDWLNQNHLQCKQEIWFFS